MKSALSLSRFVLLSALLLAALPCAQAQSIWKWRDHDGRIQISDRAPPLDIPDKDILQRPGGSRSWAPPAGAAEAAAFPGDAGSQVDPELEARKRKLSQEQTQQKAKQSTADQERRAAQRAETCRRAQAQMKAFDNGQRMTRINDKGEREFLDDGARAAEADRTRQLIQDSCN